MQVRAVISSKQPGSEMAIEVWRPNLDGGDPLTKEFKLALAELDPASSNNVNSMFSQTLQRLGFASLTTATEERVRKLGVPFRRGVLVEEIRLAPRSNGRCRVARSSPRSSASRSGASTNSSPASLAGARPEQIQQRLAARNCRSPTSPPRGDA